MKKTSVFLLIFAISVTSYSRDIDKIFSVFSKEAEADNVRLGKFAMAFIKPATLGKENSEFMKRISSLQILDLTDCSRDVKRRFEEQVKDIEKEGYDVLMRIKNNDDDILIMSKSKKDKIKELVIIEKSDPSIIRMKGNFRISDLSDITMKYE